MSNPKMKSVVLLCGLLCALFTCAMAAAQSVTGTISGTAADSSGAMIGGASITLTNERTGDVRKLTTNEDGRFVFSAVQPAPYTLKVEAHGFQALQQTNVVLSASEDLALGQLRLTLGAVTETVTINAEGARVETESSDLTARLTADQISLISTKGRDLTSLLRLIPGTSYIDDIESVGEGFGTDLPNISGQRGRSTVSSVDGLNASEPSGSNKLSMTVNQDAVAEVKVLRNNYAAEYGNNGGALINVVTKNGGQQYHGSGYYFLRNEALNANSIINKVNDRPRSLYRHNIWGLNLGGPVQVPWLFPNKKHDKLFFFYSYERPHAITPQDLRQVTMPTALERDGDFTQSITGFSKGAPVKAFVTDPTRTGPACTAANLNNVLNTCFRDPSRATASNPLGMLIIPRSRFNADGLALLNLFPLPNITPRTGVRGDGINYIIDKSVDVPKWSQVIRIDFKPTDSNSFYLKGQWWTSDNEGLGTSGWPGGQEGFSESINRWGISSHYLYKDNGMSLNWVHILSSRLVNEFAVGLRHDSEGFIPSTGMVERFSRSTAGYNPPQIFPSNNRLGLVPRATDFRGVAGVPAKLNWLDRWGETGNDYILPSISNNLSWNRGVHSFKFGAYFERIRNGEAPGGNWTGSFSFRSNDPAYTTALGNTGFAYANALVGNFLSYSESSARPFTNLSITQVQWYAQDEWKATRQFTLNYGLRMVYHSQWFQRDRLASNFDPSLWDPAKAPLLYVPFCTSGTPAPGTSCPTANQVARNPAQPGVNYNRNLVGTIVPGSGDLLDGVALMTDPATPAGFREVKPVDFEPRAGFAWDIFGAGKTVLRAMGGVYHAPRVGGGTTGGNLVNNAPQQTTITFSNSNQDNIGNLATLFGGSGSLPIGVTNLNAITTRGATPTIYNFSLGIQQDIGFKTVMEISYVGSQSRHLGQLRNINGVPDGAKLVDCRFVPASMCNPQNRNPFNGGTATSFAGAIADNLLRPYRGWGDIKVVEYTGNSNYNGLQVQVNRRYAKGLQFGAVYTWSRTLDYANDDSSDIFAPRPYRQFNYAPADFDQTHIFTANYIWDVPGLDRNSDDWLLRGFFRLSNGWQISGSTSLVSGKPKTGLGTSNVTYSPSNLILPPGGTCPATTFQTASSGTGVTCTPITDFTGGEVQARPVLGCDPSQNIPGTSVGGLPLLFNTSCFAKPGGFGDIGSFPRNFVRLPGLINTDLAIFKNFKVRERMTVQFRWETYNLLNHTNFRDVNSNMTFDAAGNQTTVNFGTPSSARPPRIMQGSLRISF